HLGKFQVISNQRAENQKVLTNLEKQLVLEHSSIYPKPFLEGEKEKVGEWQEAYNNLEEKIATIQEKLQVSENELNLKNQQLDQIEAVMWDKETLRNVEMELEEDKGTDTRPGQTSKTPKIFSGLISILVLIASFFVQPPFQWFLFGVSLLGLAGTVFL